MSRYTSCHIVCYQKCRYFLLIKKKDRVKKNLLHSGTGTVIKWNHKSSYRHSVKSYFLHVTNFYATMLLLCTLKRHNLIKKIFC